MTQNMIDKLASSDDVKIKYYCNLVRSYVEHNKYIQWCPSQGCEYAVELGIDHDGSNYQVTCICKCTFCWNCLRDGHRPVNRKTVEKWIKEIESNGLNNGIEVHAKPCPSCKQPVEKNTERFPRMTCSCGFQFCWSCLFSSDDHIFNPSIHNHCEAIKRHKNYYFERWISSHSLMQKALDNSQRVEKEDVIKLEDKYHETETQFLTEAWIHIVECRRVLKRACGYGYFILQQEFAKKQFFDHSQRLADSKLQRLQECAEDELKLFLSPKHTCTLIEYDDFRTKLVNLTELPEDILTTCLRL